MNRTTDREHNNDIHLASGPAAALADSGCPCAGPARPGPRQAHPQVMSVVRHRMERILIIGCPGVMATREELC